MSSRKSGSHQMDTVQPAESRAARRRRKRDARRGIIPPKPVPEWRRRLEGGIWRLLRWRLLREGLYCVVILVLGFALHEGIEKVSDPHIFLRGRVTDRYQQGIEGAAVEWSTSRDGGFGGVDSGTSFTGESGEFYAGRKRTRGTSLTIHKVSKLGYRPDDKPRTFRYYKDPWRIEGGSSKYVLRKWGGD